MQPNYIYRIAHEYSKVILRDIRLAHEYSVPNARIPLRQSERFTAPVLLVNIATESVKNND